MAHETVIADMVRKARIAQRTLEPAYQEEVRKIAASIGWYAVKNAERWGQLTFEETKLGDIQSKINRTQARARGLMRDLNETKTVGIIEVDEKKQLIKIAKPVGVVGGLVPVTVPAGVVFMKAMNALMGRNAIIFAPHPKAKRITNTVVNDLRALLKRLGYTEDLLQCIEEPNMVLSEELMRQVDLVIATGGAGMVKAAYSSGTPAYGVGAGNVVAVIDETADADDAASKIVESQLNDLAIGCSTENAIVIQETVYTKVLDAFHKNGAHICSEEEKKKLQKTLWIDGHLNPNLICKPAAYIAEHSGFKVSEQTTCLLVEETGYGESFPFSWEKLSVVVTTYKYREFTEAIDLVNNIQAYSGAGHSCGIHSFDEGHIMEFAMRTKTARVGIRFAQNKANAGNWNNGMPFTITLGCGTWGRNITCENITAKHYINTTWVAREIPNFRVPNDEELFGSAMQDHRI